ncbi:RNA exonuclease ngl2 [Coemansia sp. RSA 2559]|nr:RNA exonuclease ngl2 [Coemansia sp. RSA 2559]KAJ2860769.1 RNA exonuclease ngl2 [Coemansia erecta]
MVKIPNAWLQRRWLEIAKNAPSSTEKDLLTVMSYNILCQTLIKRTRYPYASKGCLKWKTRKSTLLNELDYWRADIVCLQEMGITHWNEDFSRHFNSGGYKSRFFYNIFKSHGVTISWKSSKFHVVDELNVPMDGSAEVCGESLDTQNVALIVVLRRGPEPGTVATETDVGSQANLLDRAPGVIVSNTHLYWVPGGCYERLQQQIVLLRGIKAMQEKYPDFSIISCGDFNTTPDDAGYDLLTRMRPVKLNEWQLDNLLPRTLEDDDEDDDTDIPNNKDGKSATKNTVPLPRSYADIAASPFDEESARVKRIKLEEQERRLEDQMKIDAERVQKLVSTIQKEFKPLRSCYSTYADLDSSYHTEKWQGEPIFTNYTEWKGTLDYIFFAPDSGISLREVLSLPEEKHLKPGLPNDALPSDHISLIARFDF